MSKKVRVRFAPSPTGGLHLGGVRTVLFNYLFAKHNDGEFILRIEDTDRTRFVPGAEEYINKCLEWCGIKPDESPLKGGEYGPYRQSERKSNYKQYAEQLIKDGYAYYAFDTPEELEQMRSNLKTDSNPSPQYDSNTRMQMRNSLTMSELDVKELLDNNTPYVVRIKVPENETVTFTDMIRGTISNDSNLVDDKVLLKADGMPTYHLAVVVDDHEMNITHILRGEEWLPSAPIHVLLWQYLGWGDEMPEWAHLPLILKPDGNGKLSKRDGERLGFPVFAMNWTDPSSNETTKGFLEHGFVPEAFVNMLAMLGWNDGTEQEMFTMNELIEKFSIERVHKGGAKFDFEKAKWYNQQYLQQTTDNQLLELVKPYIEEHGINVEDATLITIIGLIKERCSLLSDFWAQSHFFFKTPSEIDLEAIKPKWDDDKTNFFKSWLSKLNEISEWNADGIEEHFVSLTKELGIKKGAVMMPLRVMLVGGKYGPGIFDIAEIVGKSELERRINSVLEQISH